MEFKGISDLGKVEVYIIDDKVHDEDLETGYPLSGPRGDFVSSLLGSMGLLDKTRIACWEGHGPDKVIDDIIKYQPKIIVGLGSEMMKQFISTNKKVTEMSGQIKTISLRDQNFNYLVLMSPSYVIKRMEDSEIVLKFSQDLYKAAQFISGEYSDPLESKNVLSAHTFEEFRDIYEKEISGSGQIAYDIETNARPIFHEDSEIIGFSVSSKTTGVYISLHALDFDIDPDEETEIFDYLKKEIFSKNKLIIHNTQYERPYTLTCLGYEIKFDQADDTLVMARLLKNPKEGAGLKYQAQKYLQYPDWETDLSNYISGFREVVSRIVFGPKKYSYLWSSLKEFSKNNVFNLNHVKSYFDLSEEDREEIDNILNKLKSPMIDLYTEDEIDKLGELIFDKLLVVEDQGGILDSTIPYNWIPDRVLSKYGAIDSISTYDLCDYYKKIMDKESTEKVDLHKGYRLWLEHMYVAYIMERNGMYWNNEVASQDRIFLDNQATECLKSMLRSPSFEPMIKETCDWKYKPVILSDYLPQIATSQGYEVEYSQDTGKYIVKYQGKRVAKGKISEIQIPQVYESQYNEILKQLFSQEICNARHYEDLKEIYNPSSSTQTYIPRRILDTPELQMGGRVFQLHTLATSPEFEELFSKLPYVDQKFLKVAKLLGSPDKLKEMYGSEWSRKRRELFEGFCTMYNSMSSRVTTPEIKSILTNKKPVVIESFDDGGIINIYDNLLVTGIDQDDRSTWTPEFEWMINFRLFKKSQKIISSYIDGSVGRESVYVVNKKDFLRDDHLIKRKRTYDDNINENEDYLLAAKWSPNTVETGRWRSAMHTVPWGSQVKKYYTSRFTGGTTLCPDYCLTGDTKIRLLDGRQETLENLYNNEETEFEVYSYDLDSKRVVVGQASDLHITKETDEIYEIILDNGQSIKCTGNHPFLTLEGRYVKAENLTVGTSLKPCNFRYSEDRILSGYEELDHGRGEWEFTHHISYDQVNGPVPRKSQLYRHHINGNKLDNRTCNLELKSSSDHMSHHMKKYHETHREEFSELMRKTHTSEEYRKSASDRAKIQWETNEEFREKMHEVSKTKCADSLRKTNTMPHCIEARKEGRDEVTRNLIEETFAKVVLSGILVSERTWDEVIDQLGLKVKGCTGNSRKNIVRVFGSFINFINYMRDFLPSAYYEEVVFRTEFETKVGRVRSRTYKTYFNNFEDLGLYVSEDTWEGCIERLRDVRSEDGFKVVDPYHLPHLSGIYRYGVTFEDLKRYSRRNHRVVEIKIHRLDKSIPVYDLQVDKYHNFLVCTGESSGVFVHNSQMEVRTLAAISHDDNMLTLFKEDRDFHTETAKKIYRKDEVTTAERRFSKTATFSLLYGAMEESFAHNYCNGDMEYANMVYGGFYEAYPGVQKWIQERHAEVQRDHRVSLELSGRFIQIFPDGDGKGALNSMLRKSQNYPIQGQSADLTGGVIFDIQEYIEANNMRSLLIQYVHDSIEVDVYPYELIQLVDKLRVLLNESPMRRMGLPSKADVALGKSLGHEIEMEGIEYNKDFTEGVIELKGYKDEIYETVETWKKAYKTVEILEESYKEEFVSMGELFILRKAYTPTLGTLRYRGKCKILIKYYT